MKKITAVLLCFIILITAGIVPAAAEAASFSAGPVTSVRIVPSEVWLARNSSRQLTAVIEPENADDPAIFEYPKAERLVTDSGQQFYDS